MRPVLCRRLFVLSLLSFVVLTSQAAADRIEAVQGKQYTLTKRHGPWMIMVAGLYSTSPDGTVRDGKTPEMIADELVYELRTRGIPAYTYAMNGIDDTIETIDRLGRQETRRFHTTRGQVCVIAGNYKSLEDPTAQKTLAYIKKLYPECLGQKNVKLFKKKSQGPLSGAFLTINPLLSPEEVKAREQDPLLVKLNAGGKYSLYANKGKYSLVVATFSGKKVAHLGNSNAPEAFQALEVINQSDEAGSDGFGRFWKKDQESDLNAASSSAWELAVALRERENIDAYVWHDRYQSVVTVGSFESPNDPALKKYLMVFAPSPITQTSGGAAGDQVVFPGAPSRNFGVAAGGGNKIYAISGYGKKGDENRLWAFDPTPVMMRVPQR